MPSGLLLLEASELLEGVEEEWDAASVSAEGTADDVVEEALSDECEDADSESEIADSEAADSADDMPSESADGCHMKAPTYACALSTDNTSPVGGPCACKHVLDCKLRREDMRHYQLWAKRHMHCMVGFWCIQCHACMQQASNSSV